jgi:uncharacterized iron-regulated membrane protein
MKTRTLLQRLHRWIGIPFGLLLLVQGMTGVVMVFRAELTRAIHHSALVDSTRVDSPGAASVPVQSMLDKVRSLHPDLRVSRIEYSKQPGDALLFRLERAGEGVERYVAVDRYSGGITRDAPLSQWPVQWLFELHEELWLGAPGKNIVGTNGIVLALLALSGPFLWWPGRKALLRRGFNVSLSGGAYRGVRDLHRVGGIIVAAVLLVSGSTGIVIAWKSVVQPVIGRIMPMTVKPAAKVALQPGLALKPVDELIATARGLHANAPVSNVRFPTGDGREVTVFLHDSVTGRPRASNQLWFNGYTGEVIGTYTAATLPSGNVLIDWMLPVHSGEVLGIAGRILFLLAGLVLCLLGVTGLWQWFARRKLLRQVSRAAPPPLTSASKRTAR